MSTDTTGMTGCKQSAILMTVHPHVLVAGSTEAVEQSLAALMPYLDPPVRYWTPDTVLPSPGDMKTLVIQNIDALSAEQQRDLSTWLEQAAVARTHVVSTTTVPLFQRVAAGLFLDVLYYRLNTLMLLEADDAFGEASGGQFTSEGVECSG